MSTPVVKVGLKRLQVVELVRGDPALKDCPLLVGMPEAVLTPLLETGLLQRFPEGARLFERGAAGGSLFLVTRGEARLIGEKNGESVDVALAKKGEVVGEAEAVGAKNRAWTAIAAGEVDVIELGRDAIPAVIQQHPSTRDYLFGLDRDRKAALEDMASFLGRW